MFAVVVASAVAFADVVFAVAVANFVVGLLLLQSGTHHIAYFRVHSRASSLYFSRSVLYILAISGTSGSSGLGSQSREQIDNKTAKEGKRITLVNFTQLNTIYRSTLSRDLSPFEIVNAGDH